MVVNSSRSSISQNSDILNDSKSSGFGDNANFYEGVEKLLEVWFDSKGEGKENSLRSIFSEQVWSEEIFPLVNCTILNKSSDEFQDAYVLSESSCFVTDRRIILKTCGTTKCLQALPLILQNSYKHTNFTMVV